MGRPRLYSDPKVFADKVEDYFSDCEVREKMPTLAGLCYFMGFSDKESFGTYAGYGEDFSRTVKATRMRMEDDRNQRLAAPSCTGIIFDLKNNWGWKDKTESEVSGPNGAPIQTETKLDVSSLTDEQLRALSSIRV